MRLSRSICAVVCLSLSGCGLALWQDQSEQVQRTGRGVNLAPTSRETRAMAD